MRIDRHPNIAAEAILKKDHNVLIGISLGNKYFTAPHIREFLRWAAENTKEKIAVLIPDKIHAINYEVKNRYSRERALSVATRKGDEVSRVVKALIKELKISASKISVVRWEEIENDAYRKMLEVFNEAFQTNISFHAQIVKIVKETPHFAALGLNHADYEKLAKYVVDELPMLMAGIELDGVIYDLLPYPGLANIDYLAIDLQEGKSFPRITQKLHLKNRLRLIEAYAV